MQFMQMLKASLLPRRSAIATLAMVGVVASVMGLMPVKGAVVSAENCPNPPQTPTFNYWPVTYDSVNTPFCHDFPAIDASADSNPLQWSTSQADWDNGLSLNPGQQGVAGIYIHNGASNNLDPAQTTARNVHIITQTDTSVGTTHPITVTFTADNAAPYTRTFNVHTPANSKLEVIPNSGFMFDYEGRLILDQQNLNLGNSDFALGDLDACFEYSLFLTFKFKVVNATPPGQPALSIDKKVKNLTEDSNTGRGAVYHDSVNAKKNDRVGYRIAVTNTGSAVAENVTVSDNGVSGVSVDSGSTTVGTADDALLANNLWSGSLPGTVNLGNLQPGETRIVKYTGTVTSDICTALVNTARTIASNASQVSDSATVNVIGCTPVGNPGLSITKLVKNNTYARSYSDTTDAKTGDSVNFKITITNTGNANLYNAVITDVIPAGLQFADSVVSDGGTHTFSNNTLTVSFASPLAPGQSKNVEFAANVTASAAAGTTNTICNIAKATGTGVNQVQADACVTITTPPNPTDRKIAIKKYVKNISTNSSYSDTSVDSRTGERVMFKVTVSNTGDATLHNVVMTDRLPAGLQFDDSVDADGTTNFANNTVTVNLGSINAGQSKTVEFAAKVLATGNTSICNVAKANANNVNEVSDDACVKIYTTPKPEEPRIALSKRAFNNTKNIDATTRDADRGDYITYSLVVTNNGGATQKNFVIKDDLSQVLPLADIVSTNGGTVSGNMISYPAMDIKPGETVVKTFKVRIKQTLDKNLSYQLKNTYGNTIVINVPGKIVFVPPVTGAAGTSAGIFAGLLTAGFVVVRKRDSILKFILA